MNCGKGDLQALLRIAILCIQCPERHFAEVNECFVSIILVTI